MANVILLGSGRMRASLSPIFILRNVEHISIRFPINSQTDCNKNNNNSVNKLKKD